MVSITQLLPVLRFDNSSLIHYDDGMVTGGWSEMQGFPFVDEFEERQRQRRAEKMSSQDSGETDDGDEAIEGDAGGQAAAEAPQPVPVVAAPAAASHQAKVKPRPQTAVIIVSQVKVDEVDDLENRPDQPYY